VKQDFLEITDFSTNEIIDLFELAKDLKSKTKDGIDHHILKGQTLAMLFQKPSTRTRISFEVGMYQLGGHALYMSPNEVGLGERESVADVAQVLSRFNDGIMARVFGHDIVTELADCASVPVINGLSDFTHPCQILGDMLTIIEHKGTFENIKIAYVGDGNNVANSWINLTRRLPINLNIGVPKGYEPNRYLVAKSDGEKVGKVKLFNDPVEAVKNADVVYTDVWASMGQEEKAIERQKIFSNFQVNEKLMSFANESCLFLHCLPAHRGSEVTDNVIDAANSVVFDEAENRLHIQKAIMAKLMAKG
jgi:ornithine carbamoyltransferase